MAASILSDKKFLLLLGMWWLAVMLMQFLILRELKVDDYHSAVDAAVSIVLLAALCFALSNNMRFYLPGKEKFWYILISSLLLCFIWMILTMIVFRFVFGNDSPYISFFKETVWVRYGGGFLMAGSITMLSLLLYNSQEQKEMQSRHNEAEKLAREAELFKLRQQLQPHFLFNSLNSISALTINDPEKARQMVQQLSEFLRGMLRRDDDKEIPLKNELRYISLYLEIEKVRFGNRLKTEIDCPDNALEKLLPPMILQPVVENAIKFGLYDTTGEVLIKIVVSFSEGYLRISVQNPFDPETNTPLAGTGFGLSSIARRLYLLFSRTDLIRTYSREAIFFTEISIPQL